MTASSCRTRRCALAARYPSILLAAVLFLAAMSLNPLSLRAATMVAVAAGENHSVFLKPDGTVWGWGRNNSGQLGNGTTANATTALSVPGFSGAQSVAAGAVHTVVSKSDGTVWTWGTNGFGQLGNGSTVDSSTPVQVTGLGGIQAISAGESHTLALKSDGTVWAWGRNDLGQVGNGSSVNASSPVQVSGLTGVQAVAAGGFHSIALKTDGTVWTWGHGAYGQLGTPFAQSNTPMQVVGLTAVQAIAAGDVHSLALKSDGTVWAWGDNNFGKLGDGTTTSSSTPVQVLGLAGVQVITARKDYTIALKFDGTLWSWGRNFYGQLGNGSTTDPSPLMQVVGLTGVQAVTTGWYHALAIRSDGTLWAWGRNAFGQIGNGTTTDSSEPVPVTSLSVSPARLSFASRVLGTTSPAQAVTLTNLATAPGDITSIEIAGDFAKTTTCGFSLAAGASCEVFVTYAPIAPVRRGGSLTITSSAFGSPHAVTLFAFEGARADFDADNKSDVLLRHANGTNYFWRVDGASIANLSLAIPGHGYLPGLDPGWTIAGVGDFNGDGKADVVLRHANGTNYIWHLDGAIVQSGVIGIVSHGYVPGLDPSWTIAGVGDFNGDGKSDLLLRHANGTVYVWQLDGANIVAEALSIASQGYLPSLDANWTIAGIGDFNADGKSDVLLRHADGSNRVWHLDGETIVNSTLRIVRDSNLQSLDPSWTIAGVGDFNGDGKSDVLLRNANGTNYVWHLDGASPPSLPVRIVSHGYLPGLDGNWSIAALGDFNGDGKTDVLLRHTNGTNYAWHIDGASIANSTLSIPSQGYLPSLDAGWSIIKK